jgi:hypothetical protein
MEEIISGSDKPKEETKKPETPKSTLQMLAAAKPKEINTPVTPLTGVTPLTEASIVRPVTPLTGVTPVIKTEEQPIAPVKNFQKVSNSIAKQAIPAGVFKSGKSKELYDVLYSLTRGAFNPARTVQISKPKLQKLAGIGAPQTLSQGLMHLQLVGLVKIVSEAPGGKHEGHEYEVFLYEETLTGVTPLTPVSGVRNLPHLLPLESNPGYSSLNVENKANSENAKTSSLKTNTKNDDDEAAAFSELNKKLAAAVKKITGKNVSEKEAGKWSDLADLLILELEVAAKRTGVVSSVPAFLTEVLRRQFFAARQRPASKTSKEIKKDTVGKSETGSYEIKPLDKQGREAAVEQLREFAGDEFLQDFKKWYTSEDWEWITKQLKS